MASSDTEICRLSAVAMTARIRKGELSVRDTLEAHLREIERLNPKVNAIVTLAAETARARALAADEAQAQGKPLGPLHGLPVVHKDMQPTKGLRTTWGSPIYRNFVPTEDSLLIERIGRSGAITLGKTNVPEFGAGSQTYNEVFGPTFNPWDTSKTCGGSSGGAAVALACGMAPLADGSDLGGSLRNPGTFNHVVGLRPSPGRVPAWPVQRGWISLMVEGPMARTAADVALFLSAIAGPDLRAPMSLEKPGSEFAAPLGRDFKGARIAWWKGLDGIPVDPRVRKITDAARPIFESMGCVVEADEPDFTGADAAFKTLRFHTTLVRQASHLPAHRSLIKPDILWEVEQAERLTSRDVGAAESKHTEIYHRMRRFMEKYDFFVLPVSQVPPFPVTQPYPTEIDGVKMETYIDWMKSCYYITMTGAPAISVPFGFTEEGLPVGIQIVGQHRDDWGLLQMAHAFEQAVGQPRRWPALAG